MIHLTIELNVASAKWKRAFPKMKGKIEQAAAFAFMNAKKPAAFKNRSFGINILLATDAAIKKLNRDFRGMDKPTNVLSFPQFTLRHSRASGNPAGVNARAPRFHGDDGFISLGDVALAFETIKRECREQNKTLENHTIHLVVHGVLHLLGYDHMKIKDAKTMEKLECDILDALGYPDPYHDIVPSKKAGS